MKYSVPVRKTAEDSSNFPAVFPFSRTTPLQLGLAVKFDSKLHIKDSSVLVVVVVVVVMGVVFALEDGLNEEYDAVESVELPSKVEWLVRLVLSDVGPVSCTVE